MEGLREGVPQSGRYLFRILAESKFRQADMNPKKFPGVSRHDPAQPHRLALTVGSLVGIDPSDRALVSKAFAGDSLDGDLANVSSGGKVLATWDVPDDVPTWLEGEVWLEAGQFPRFSFQNGPSDSGYTIHTFISQNKYSLLDKDQLAAYEASKISVHSGQLVHFETPRIRLYRVDVTGPIEEIWPPASHRAIFGAKPYESAAAGDVLRAFAERAWRRPVIPADVEPLLAIVRQAEKTAVATGVPPQEAERAAIKRGIQAVLCDPAFLYREERGGVLDGYEIASRLSYFLWSSMPDETLLSRAAAGDLVRKEWGGEFDENVRLGKRAVREFGLETSVEKLEAALGSADLVKLTAKLGRGLKEDSFAGGSVPAAGLTKEGAKEELALLQKDKAFATRYLAGEAEAVRKFTRLHEVAFAE
jgi:hypothetical protein